MPHGILLRVSQISVFQLPYQTHSVEPVISDLEDTFPDNGTTVQRNVYSNGTNGVSVEHLRIEGGQHIWSFFRSYDLNGKTPD